VNFKSIKNSVSAAAVTLTLLAGSATSHANEDADTFYSDVPLYSEQARIAARSLQTSLKPPALTQSTLITTHG